MFVDQVSPPPPEASIRQNLIIEILSKSCLLSSDINEKYIFKFLLPFQDGIRHQLRVSGVSRWVYWLHFFIADLTLYIFPVVLILILIPAFDVKALNNANALGSLFLLLLLYNPTSLVFSYLYSFAFTNWHTMQNVLGSVQIIVSVLFLLSFLCSMDGKIIPDVDGAETLHTCARTCNFEPP